MRPCGGRARPGTQRRLGTRSGTQRRLGTRSGTQRRTDGARGVGATGFTRYPTIMFPRLQFRMQFPENHSIDHPKNRRIPTF